MLASLRDHRDLGIHTELLSDGIVDLVERGVVTGVNKQLRRNKIVATFALGTRGSTTGWTTTRPSRCCRSTSSTTRG